MTFIQTRNTIQRQIVLQTVLAMHEHPTADDVYVSVATDHPSISKATVYRNLNQLVNQGEIRRVAVPNGADRFDFNMKEHFHVRCNCCGGIFDVYMPHIENLLEQIEDSSNVTVQRYDILFEGICPMCRDKNENAG